MRKRIVAIMMTLLVAVGMFTVPVSQTKAAEDDEVIIIDGSELTDDEESEGFMEMSTWGVYLQSGSCKISKVGTGKICAIGSTFANTTVSTVKVSVIVERLKNGSWYTYTSWTATKTNAISVTTSKTLTVPTGYYYRVRAIHSANSDGSSSATNGIYI